MKMFLVSKAFMFFFLLQVFIFSVGCASSGTSSTVWQPGGMDKGNAVEVFDSASFDEITFSQFPGGNVSKDMLGKLIKLKVSYVGVAPGFQSGSYGPDKYFTYLVGKPINQYMANNPMRGPRGHVFAVIENQRAAEVFGLPQDKNFYIYAKVVRLGEAGSGEYGLKTVKFEP